MTRAVPRVYDPWAGRRRAGQAGGVCPFQPARRGSVTRGMRVMGVRLQVRYPGHCQVADLLTERNGRLLRHRVLSALRKRPHDVLEEFQAIVDQV